MYEVKKVLNTNVVLVTDGEKEFIAFGKGLGYHQKIGAQIEQNQISKMYAPISDAGQSELIASLEKIPAKYFEVTRQIVEYAEVVLDSKLKANIYYSLTDHLSFAIERHNANLTLGNRVFWEMKTYYPTEFQIGMHALSIIKNNLEIELPKEEAANIAFHIINASTTVDNSNVLEVSSLVDNILQTLRVLTHGKIKQEGINYDRFVTHIKFFSERYISGNMLADDPTLIEHVFEQYQEASQIGLKLEKTIYTLYEKQITKEELAYLIIHIHRVLTY